MSDSTSPLDLIQTAQAQKEVTANAALNALSPASLYALRATTTAALTWGFYGGRWNGALIANGTLALTASTTNYVVALRSTGAVSVSTSITNWNDRSNYMRLYLVVAGASTVTSYQDHRQCYENHVSGREVLVAGTVTVSNASVTATSVIQLTSQVGGGTVGFLGVSSRVPGVSFTVTSSSATDTSTVGWTLQSE